MLSSLNPFSTKGKRIRAIIKEADRRGMTVEELSKSLSVKELSDIANGAAPAPELSEWGLVPFAALTEAPSTGVPSIDAATEAAARGDWRPAAELLADSYGRWDFRACAVASLATVAADEDRWLVEWRAAAPDDRHVEIVDCAALPILAWQFRGTKPANETLPEQFADFRLVLAQAETAATEATLALPDDPTPWSILLTVARGLGSEQARFDEVWQGLTERAPLHRRAHQSALLYLSANWYGSYEEMFAFAEQVAALSPALSVLVLQGAFEKQSDDPKVWRQANVREALDTFLRWLDTDGAHNVDLRDDLGWAALALVESGRGAEAIPIFQRLGTHAGGLPWSNAVLPARFFNKYRIRACKPR